MKEREQNYGKFKGKTEVREGWLDDNVFYLKEIDENWRRFYDIKNSSQIDFKRNIVSSMARLENINKSVGNKDNLSKFYKLPVQ